MYYRSFGEDVKYKVCIRFPNIFQPYKWKYWVLTWMYRIQRFISSSKISEMFPVLEMQLQTALAVRADFMTPWGALCSREC